MADFLITWVLAPLVVIVYALLVGMAVGGVIAMLKFRR